MAFKQDGNTVSIIGRNTKDRFRFGGVRPPSLQVRYEISGLSSLEFLDELGRRRIPINYEAEDLRVDLDTLKGLP